MSRSPGTPRRFRFQSPPLVLSNETGDTVTPGWEGRARVPPASRGSYAQREGRAAASASWGPRHEARLEVVRSLLSAGHVQRRWESDGEKYTEGPCAGFEVKDAWLVAGRVADCCADGVYHVTRGGKHGGASIAPERCGEKHVCPICAAATGARRAEGITIVGARDGRPGALISVVLTHRDRGPGEETCAEGWERMEDAYQRLRDRSTKHGRWFFSRVYGGCCCLETTSGKTGATWHPHMHCLWELLPGVDWEVFREELAEHWAEITELAGKPCEPLFSGLTNSVRGWDRRAGFDDESEERWCELIAPGEPTRVVSLEERERVKAVCYQVAKYPSPVATLANPERMAEFVTWAHGQKLIRWLGRWHDSDVQEWIREGVRYQAEEARQERVRRGDAPDVGAIVRGFKALSVHGVDEKQAETPDDIEVTFEAARGGEMIRRWASDLACIRAWWRMAGVQHRLMPVLEDTLTPDAVAELEQRFRELRKMSDIPAALDAWGALRSSEGLWQWTDGRLNAWHKERRTRVTPTETPIASTGARAIANLLGWVYAGCTPGQRGANEADTR